MGRPMRVVAALAVAVFCLPACELNRAEDAPASGSSTGIDFRACQAIDASEVDGRSYNQDIAAGLDRAATYLGVATSHREVSSPTDLEKVIDSFVLRGCNLIVAPDTAGDLESLAEANRDTLFALVDVDGSSLEETATAEGGNITEITFYVDQAAFLAGYVAAGTSASRTIATLAGRRVSENVDPIRAFAEGGRAYGDAHGFKITVLGAPRGPVKETATGSDEDDGLVQAQTLAFVRDGADVVYPVAGPASVGALPPAAGAAGRSIALVWSGTNGCRALPESCELFLTSVVNNYDNAVYDVIKEAVAERLDGGTYVGSLVNGGVGLSPYHSHRDEVSPELRQEVADLRDDIIAGRSDYFGTAD
jgi:basic membrane protein A